MTDLPSGRQGYTGEYSIAGMLVAVCQDCGVLVVDRGAHDRWHGASDLRDLHSFGYYTIPGKGTTWSVRGIPGLNPRELQGQKIKLGGDVVTVVGVETPGLIDPTGHDFGLVVKR